MCVCLYPVLPAISYSNNGNYNGTPILYQESTPYLWRSQDSSFTENKCLAVCLHMHGSLGTYIMRLLQWWPLLRRLCMRQFIDVICKYVLDYYLYCCGIGPTLSMILLVLKIWCVMVRKTSTLISLSQRLTSV